MGECRRRPSTERRPQPMRGIEGGPTSPSSLESGPMDCKDSEDGCVAVDAVDTSAFWTFMEAKGADDCKRWYNPSSFSSSLSVLVADGLLTVLRFRPVSKGKQSLFSRAHLYYVNLMLELVHETLYL